MKIRTGMLIAVGGVVAAAVVVAVGVVGSRRVSSSQGGRSRPKRAPAELAAQMELKGVQLQDFDLGGKLRWVIRSAGKLSFDRARLVGTGQNVAFELVRPDGKSVSLLAPLFRLDYQARRASLTGGVKAGGSGGLSFSAPSAEYDLDAEHLRAPGPVTAATQDYNLAAGALGFDRVSSVVTLVGGVTLKFRDYVLTAGKAAVDTTKRHATLTAAPRVARGDYTASASTVQVDAPSQEVRLERDVVVQRGDLSATGENGVFDKVVQRAQLRGGVTLKGRGFTATGGRLVLDAERHTATLSGGRVHLRTKILR